MTDKKKLDEAATLNVSTEQDGITATTTFTADDVVGLAMLLKRAGIESAQFTGPATLTADAATEAGTVSTTIQAPDLRSIMSMLEPEFQMAGDMEAELDAMGAETDNDDVMDPAPEEMPLDAPMEPVEEPMGDVGAVDAVVDDEGNLELAGPEMEVEEQLVNENSEDDFYEEVDRFDPANLTQEMGTDHIEGTYQNYDVAYKQVPAGIEVSEADQEDMIDELTRIAGRDSHPEMVSWVHINEYGEQDSSVPNTLVVGWYDGEMNDMGDEMDEEADYDYREHDVHPHEWGGKASRDIVQPSVKPVPARSGDNPLAEAGKSFADYVKEAQDRNTVEVVPEKIITAESLLDEFRLDELSAGTRDSYFAKAAKQADHHARLMGMHDELGNDEMVGKHRAHIQKRVKGMKSAIEADKKK